MITTIQKVRDISGLNNSANVINSAVKHKIAIAESMFNGAVVRKYQLPLTYRRSNTIAFTGAGSGNDTMAITVNGTIYNVEITNGLTAVQAAALFYDSAEGNTDFKMDVDGGIVTLISIKDSTDLTMASAQVNVSPIGTVEGITALAGVRADRYPPMADQVVAEIAASLLLMDNYGIEGQDTAKDGDKRMERINRLILQIQGKDDSLPDFKVIDEVTHRELPTSDGNTPRFSFNKTTSPPLVTISQKF